MIRALATLAVLAAACSDPQLSLRFRLTAGDAQQCFGDDGDVTTSCQDVTMLCQAYLSIRVLPPDDPEAPFISVCRPLTGAQGKLCAIAGIDLPQPAMPIVEQTLEVQMAIFPASEIKPDPVTGEPVCPRVQYGANGLPMPVLPVCDDVDLFACPRVPAVGGRTFYNPGDDTTIVDLGCTNLAEITDPQVCIGVDIVRVSATVNNFDDLVSSVDKTVADRLNVSVGEPTPLADTFVLTPMDSRELMRSTSSSPSWSSVLTDLDLVSIACLEVLEDGAQTTATLTCNDEVATRSMFDLPGFYLKRASLTEILEAIGYIRGFPEEGGLVVGMVVDRNSSPLAGQQVTCDGCTIQYLDDTRSGVVTGATSTSGVFVTQDAPFGTVFSLPMSPRPFDAVGGVVEGKVTIVILRYGELDPG